MMRDRGDQDEGASARVGEGGQDAAPDLVEQLAPTSEQVVELAEMTSGWPSDDRAAFEKRRAEADLLRASWRPGRIILRTGHRGA